MDATTRKALLSIVVASATMINEREKKKKRKSVWVKPWLKRRLILGTYKTLFRELKTENVVDFTNYTRVTPDVFELILNKISPKISKQDTVMRKSIPAGARLEATLRFLAGGEAYSSLQYSTRISKHSLSAIIPETCEAIYQALKDDYLKVSVTFPIIRIKKHVVWLQQILSVDNKLFNCAGLSIFDRKPESSQMDNFINPLKMHYQPWYCIYDLLKILIQLIIMFRIIFLLCIYIVPQIPRVVISTIFLNIVLFKNSI